MPEILTKTIPEHRVEGKPLGRHVVHDPRSLNFAASQAKAIRNVSHGYHGLPLNQTRGSCTAEALVGSLDSDPDYAVKGLSVPLTQKDADALYDEEIILEGGDPSVDDPGGSGLMVCKAAKRMGLIRRYESAFGLDHALKALVIRPTITGVNWYEGYDSPDANGVVRIAGGIRGGHEFVLLEIILEKRLVGAMQSWGPRWGVAKYGGSAGGGRFYIRFDDFDRLLHEQGDCTVPLP